jgi:PAS domain S-box-containing protein
MLEDVIARALLQGEGEAIVASDAEGIIQFWNAGAARVFGFSSDEAVGQSLDIIIPERLRARHWDGYRETMRTGKSRYGSGDLLSVPALRKDGAQISVEFTIAVVRGEQGDMVGLVAVMRDATKRFNELKALRKELREKAGR